MSKGFVITVAGLLAVFVAVMMLAVYRNGPRMTAAKPALSANQAGSPRLLTDAEFGIPPAPRLLTDTEVGFAPSPVKVAGMFDDLIPPSGLPSGAWASRLEVVTTEPNLFRDPITKKLYRLQGGKIVENTDIYAGLSLEAIKHIVQSQADAARIMADSTRKQAEDMRQIETLYELRRANSIASEAVFNQRMANYQQSFQNQQAINILQGIQLQNQLQPRSYKLISGVWFPSY